MKSSNIEKYSEHRDLELIFADILDSEPKPIKASVPSNLEDQKRMFLDGDIRNPEFIYDGLSSIDYDMQKNRLMMLKEEVTNHPLIPEKYLQVYISFITRFLDMLNLLQNANGFNASLDPAERSYHQSEFMRLNSELYGSPNQETFVGLLSEKMNLIRSHNLDDGASEILDQLEAILSKFSLEEASQRYRPSEETIARVSTIANDLYGSLFSHIDQDKESYSPEQTRSLFEEIIDNEFGESAEGWRVIIDNSGSINVVASEKLIKIPFNRKPIKPQEMRGLVAHEIGVHFMRAVMGGETDMLPLQIGFAGYYDAEEGFGKVMEQGAKGKYMDSGIPYYLISGLFANGSDFRETHEAMWRLEVLGKLSNDTQLTEDMIKEVKETSFKQVLRVARLTNGLPWYKDLSYYNGSNSMWQYLEDNSDDFEKFIVLFYGKIDPANPDHERSAYEAHSI